MDNEYQTDPDRQKIIAQFLQAQEQARKMMQPVDNPIDVASRNDYQGDYNSPESRINPNLQIMSSGGVGNGITSGFGQIRGNIPIGEDTTISPYAGGAGAFGSAGGQRMGMFMPQIGVNFTHKF